MLSEAGEVGVKDQAKVTPYLVTPVIALIVQVLAIASIPWEVCSEGVHSPVDGSFGHHVLTGVTIAASLVVAMAAFVRLGAYRREAGLGRTPLPALWAIPIVALGAFALIESGELRRGFAVVAIVGIPAAVIGFFGVLSVGLEGGYAREARGYLPIYLLGSALALYPSLAIYSLHASTHPSCGFG